MLGETTVPEFKQGIKNDEHDHKGDVCFINKLPHELLSRIIELGHVKHMGGCPRPPSHARVFPEFQIRASHVCRHWRNVAISTPSFWTEIILDPCSRPPYTLATTLLERSKSLPIDILIFDTCLDCIQKRFDDDLHGFTMLLTKLIPHIYRWRTMRLMLNEFRVLSAFLRLISDHSTPAALNLTSFQLAYLDFGQGALDNSISQHLTLFGASASFLTRLVLVRVRVDWDQPWIASASSLKELQLCAHAEGDRPSWAQFSTILQGASSLEKLVLRQSSPSGDPATWFIEPTSASSPHLNDPIPLPHLAAFELGGCSQACGIGLLRRFCLPALKHLHLSLYEGDFTEFIRELAGPATCLPQRSTQERPCSLLSGLESLDIVHHLECHTDCIEMLYGELQNATSLVLSERFLLRSFFDILGSPCTLPRGGVWLPRLEALYLREPSGGAVRALVQQRKALGAPLDALYLEKGYEVDVDDEAWLRENVKTVKFFREPFSLGPHGHVLLV